MYSPIPNETFVYSDKYPLYENFKEERKDTHTPFINTRVTYYNIMKFDY